MHGGLGRYTTRIRAVLCLFYCVDVSRTVIYCACHLLLS